MTQSRRTRLASFVALAALLAIVVAVVTWTVLDRLPQEGGTSTAAEGGQPGSEASPLPASGGGRASRDDRDDHVVFRDQFEKSALPGWTTVREGSGSVRVVSGQGRDHTKAARINVRDANESSRAFLSHRLDAPARGVSASGWFKVMAGGCDKKAVYSHGNVPFFRFFDHDGRRLVSLFRINGGCKNDSGAKEELWLQHSGHYYRTLGAIELGRWYHITLSASTGKAGKGLIQVDLDDQRVYRTRKADNGSEPIETVTVHNEVKGQVGDLVVDRVSMSTFDPVTQQPATCDAGEGGLPGYDGPGKVAVIDGFESGGLTQWSEVDRRGDARVSAQPEAAHDGGCGLRIEVTSKGLSLVRLSKDLPPGTHVVAADGWYHVTAEGATSNNVPLVRLFNGDTRILDVHRQNRTANLGARTLNRAGKVRYALLGAKMSLGEWHHVRVLARSAGEQSSFTVELDGEPIYRSGKISMRKGAFTSFVLGSEHDRQEMILDVDDVVVTTGRQ